MAELFKTFYKSPVGILEIAGNNEGIMAVTFLKTAGEESNCISGPIPECLKECVTQLDEYFKGKRQSFSIKLAFAGTEFQRKVWQSLSEIPYGKTISYLELAEKVGNKRAVRAVGGANRRNPLPVIIPCHRVIGADGSLTGYAGELWRKRWLLEHEARA